MWVDCVLILLFTIFFAILGEGLAWLITYRTKRYKFLLNYMKQQNELSKKKKEVTANLISNNKNLKKKINKQEQGLKSYNHEFILIKMKSMIAMSFTFGPLISILNYMYSGKVIAKLPFTPLGFVQILSHRNLPGNDLTDCSFFFFYILCTIFARQNIEKFLGFAPPRKLSKT